MNSAVMNVGMPISLWAADFDSSGIVPGVTGLDRVTLKILELPLAARSVCTP